MQNKFSQIAWRKSKDNSFWMFEHFDEPDQDFKETDDADSSEKAKSPT